MPVLKIFVDTGMDGACVVFSNGTPLSYFRFKKNGEGRGIQSQPFIEWLSDYKDFSCVIEEPAMVKRSPKTLCPQWFVVGQIFTLLQDATEVHWIHPSTWQAHVRKRLPKAYPDTKEMARAMARQAYPEWVAARFPKSFHSGVADCLALAQYWLQKEDDLISMF